MYCTVCLKVMGLWAFSLFDCDGLFLCPFPVGLTLIVTAERLSSVDAEQRQQAKSPGGGRGQRSKQRDAGNNVVKPNDRRRKDGNFDRLYFDLYGILMEVFSFRDAFSEVLFLSALWQVQGCHRHDWLAPELQRVVQQAGHADRVVNEGMDVQKGMRVREK